MLKAKENPTIFSRNSRDFSLNFEFLEIPPLKRPFEHHLWHFEGMFLVFSGYSGCVFWGSRISVQGGIFGIFRGNSRSSHLGSLWHLVA